LAKRIAVIGAGSWGTALSQVLATSGYEVSLWAREEEICKSINTKHENILFMPGVLLSDKINASTDIRQVLTGQRLILAVVPSQYLRATLTQATSYIENDALIISAVNELKLLHLCVQHRYKGCTGQ
jgi:Glycerol-3-phosphate dehydrogenase